MQRRLTLGATVLLLVGDCDLCRPDPPPKCDPCDSVAMLRDSDRIASGSLTPVPDEVQEFCEEHEIPAELRPRWEHQGCWEYTAHYLVRSLEWSGDLDASWTRQTRGTFACKDTLGAAGCNQAPPHEPADIVGPLELEPEGLSPIAMFVDPAEWQDPDEQALQQDLPDLIQSVLDGESCEHARWVFDDACAAFLVGERHVLTAQHCRGPSLPKACGGEGEDALADRVLVFDYVEQPGQGTTVVEGLTVVACGTENGQPSELDEHDWMLLELPTPQAGRQTLQLPEPQTVPDACELVYAVGHPLGHPQYRSGSVDPLAPSAWISGRHVPPRTFHATLDVVKGLSGGPVLALEDDRLIGLLVAGRFDLGTPCAWVFECGAAGCTAEWEYARIIDLAQLHDALAPLLAS